MNWEDLRFFLAIAHSGSLSQAGRRLGVSQPTVSRRLAAMEARMGVSLIDRIDRGHKLTAAGNEILAAAEHVAEEIAGISRRVSGRDRVVSGNLRITCTDVMANCYLAGKLAGFAAQNPGIDLNIICSLQHLSLTRREADVALRVTGRPPETLVGRRLAGVAIGVYGAASDRHAWEQRSLADADWIGWEDDTYNTMMIAARFPEARIRHRTSDMLVIAAMARAGLGLVVLPCYMGDTDPGLRRVVPDPADEHLMDLWVLTHPDLRRTARVRAVTEFIADAVISDRDLFEGRRPQGV
ncbi:MAG: LysR family transcriptional regulator [Alphaproteobacteria bacterium]|nr:LysR family transcriptional regulator [Alphaproteobacteria bacterium]